MSLLMSLGLFFPDFLRASADIIQQVSQAYWYTSWWVNFMCPLKKQQQKKCPSARHSNSRSSWGRLNSPYSDQMEAFFSVWRRALLKKMLSKHAVGKQMLKRDLAPFPLRCVPVQSVVFSSSNVHTWCGEGSHNILYITNIMGELDTAPLAPLHFLLTSHQGDWWIWPVLE